MSSQEVERIISRLSAAFTFNKFDEPGVMTEYKRALLKYSFDSMNRAVDHLIESTDGKGCPAIGQLIKAAKENKPAAVEIKNEQYCEVCDDKGYVVMTECEKLSPKYRTDYQYVLYCPFCSVGQAQSYKGDQKKEFKSPYKVPPLTEYFDDDAITAMRKSNREKARTLTESEIKAMQRQLRAVGANLPVIKSMRGDAWEPEEARAAPWD